MAASAHSAAVAAFPRRWNCRIPRCSFKVPITGSTIALRFLYQARPGALRNLLRERSKCGSLTAIRPTPRAFWPSFADSTVAARPRPPLASRKRSGRTLPQLHAPQNKDDRRPKHPSHGRATTPLDPENTVDRSACPFMPNIPCAFQVLVATQSLYGLG
jgi:hypothetical protein